MCLLLVLSSCGGESISPATPTPFPEATFAGRTADENLFAAIITTPEGVEAYLCDGNKGLWFRGGGSADSVLELTGTDGARLTLQLDADRVVGNLLEGEASVTAFSLPKVEGEVLFRAEDTVGETPVLGGWIRLPDGEQRGLVASRSLATSSTLGSSNDLRCVACEGLTAGLTPAPFTPSAALRRPNVMPRFTVLGLGDSYMSGEGAPVVEGNLINNGSSGTQERWSDGLPVGAGFTFTFAPGEEAALAREARACHRGEHGLGVAVAGLQRAWTRVQFIEQQFACSGAQVAQLVSANYGGPAGCSRQPNSQAVADCVARTDDFGTNAIEPQLPAARLFLSRNRLSPDAVVMHIGGNDLGFGDIIADCISGDCAASDSNARRVFAAGSMTLPVRYQELASALTRAGIPAANVHLAQVPNPLRRTSSDLCAGLDFDDALLRLVSDEEALFATMVHGDINRLVTAATTTHGWKLVSSHVGTEVGHGACNGAQAWFNDTPTALRTQGADLLPQALGAIQLSAGMVHPNKAGHRDLYAPAYRKSLEDVLSSRLTPRTPTRFRATKFVRDGAGARVTLQWDDVNTFETSTVVRGTAGAGSPGVRGDVTTVDVVLDSTNAGAPKGTVTVKACFEGPTDLCSAETAPLSVEVKVPTHTPTNVFAGASLFPEGIRLSWRDLDPTRLFSTVELDIGGVVTRRAVEEQSLLLPATTDLRRYRVVACNTLGCGPTPLFQDFKRPTNSLPPPCVPPQQSVLNGCR